MKFVHEPFSGGTLYVVATPLGNLDDISPRARAVLSCVDRIVAEDTRVARRLQQALGLPSIPVSSSFEGNEAQKAALFSGSLSKGESLALITDAGTPCISDPGSRLVAEAHRIGARVIPVPGPCALTAALSVSGFDASRFHFLGFLPAKSRERKKKILEISSLGETVVMYESPHRIRETLSDLAEGLGIQRRCVICREISKRFETISHGSLGDLRDDSSETVIKGEFTLVLEPFPPPPATMNFPSVEREITRLRSLDLPVRTVATILAPWMGMSKSEVYDFIVKFEKQHTKLQGE